MELLVVKVIGLVVLFVLTLAFALLPILISRRVNRVHNSANRHKYQLIISLISCLGGGVFLATCFLDLYPEVEEQLDLAFKKLNLKNDYPCSEFIVIVGFLLILICEQVALSCKENSLESHPLLGHSHDHSVRTRNTGNLNGVSDQISAPENLGYSMHQDPGSHSSLRSIVLVLALSLHSIFEGLAVGLQPDISEIAQVLTAILIHKCIIAFTLSLNLIQSKLAKKIVLECVIVFSLMSPFGTMIGLFVMDFDKGVEVYAVSGILQGFACGTFLYVTFFEVLPHELNNSENRLLKMLFVVMGFATVSVLIMFLPA